MQIYLYYYRISNSLNIVIEAESKSLWDILVQYVIGAISGLFTVFAGCAAVGQFLNKVKKVYILNILHEYEYGILRSLSDNKCPSG